jgi:hypothetical protein
MFEKIYTRVKFLGHFYKKPMVCLTDEPIYINMYADNSDDDMPALEYPEEYPEEEEPIVNPAEEEEVVRRRRNDEEEEEDQRQPNDYEEYLEEMLEYYSDSLQRQPVFFPTTFDLPPQLSRGGGG